MPKVSIIIPVYNSASKGLNDCIDSVLAQSFSDFELIIINDGSTDDSLTICRQFTSIDNRIKLIDKKNGGVSTARNAGISIACGEFITFIDSDDIIEKQYIEKLVKISNHTDLVVCGMIQYWNNGKQKKYQAPEGCFNMSDAVVFHQLIHSRLVFGPCNKLFKTEIIHHHRIQFPEGLDYGEDRLFCFEYLRYCKNFTGTNTTHYDYLIQDGNSLSTIYRPDIFYLEYDQWKRLYKVYEQLNVLSRRAKKDLYTELFWMINDEIAHLAQTHQLSRGKLEPILDKPEIFNLKRYSPDINTNRFIKSAILNRSAIRIILYYKLLSICQR